MKHSKIRILFVLLTVIACAGYVQAQELIRPANIILLIGDGMGIAHITATEFEKRELSLRRFKKLGLQTTPSFNDFVTDSAAAGTALSSGIKTINGYVGLDPYKKPVKNLFEHAKENGKTVGVVVTSTVNHATPAAFTSHVESREYYNEIAEQQVASDIDVIFGGGLCNFIPKFMPGSRRKDERNLLFELRRKMPVVQTWSALKELPRTRKAAAILSEKHLPHADKRDYSLGDLTRKAIEILSLNKNGFVMMVEGSQIDLVAHKNDYEKIMSETLDFDTAVAAALDFAEKDGNTLVVVTSDHETGGLTLVEGSLKERRAKSHFSTDQHSASMVAIFSFGPGADLFTGIIDNTTIGKNLIELVK